MTESTETEPSTRVAIGRSQGSARPERFSRPMAAPDLAKSQIPRDRERPSAGTARWGDPERFRLAMSHAGRGCAGSEVVRARRYRCASPERWDRAMRQVGRFDGPTGDETHIHPSDHARAGRSCRAPMAPWQGRHRTRTRDGSPGATWSTVRSAVDPQRAHHGWSARTCRLRRCQREPYPRAVVDGRRLRSCSGLQAGQRDPVVTLPQGRPGRPRHGRLMPAPPARRPV